ncbi:hypothetical protein V1509DRAFT_638881 [Lipomyces kononenkoae]
MSNASLDLSARLARRQPHTAWRDRESKQVTFVQEALREIRLVRQQAWQPMPDKLVSMYAGPKAKLKPKPYMVFDKSPRATTFGHGMLSTFPPTSSSHSLHSFDPSSATSASRQSYVPTTDTTTATTTTTTTTATTTTMDGRDSQPASFGSYNGTSTPAHSMPYDGQDSNTPVAGRQHYQPAGQYDTATDAAAAAAAAARQYAQAPTYLARPYPTDPRYAASAAQANGYATDPSVALAGYQGYPPGATAGAWRAEWYPPVSTAFPPHAVPVGAAPPIGALGVPRAGDNRMRRGGRVGEFPGNTVYSFVPLPGAAQQKRPRRRYEEIERIYKCGWQGCEKAYGTLNHLNAHVTMQNHGPKRTPEEFKETRKEWKARKKEEEARRKAESDSRGGHPQQPQQQQPQQQQSQQQQQQQQQQQTSATAGQPGQSIGPSQQAGHQSGPIPLHPQGYSYPDPYAQYQ